MGWPFALDAQRLVAKARLRLSPSYQIRVGDKPFRAPGHLPDAVRLALDWKENWKTTIIRQQLAGRPGAFIDVGAHIGETLIDFLAAENNARRYVGFEPNLLNAGRVAAMIDRNKLRNAHIVSAALSDRCGMAELLTRKGAPMDPAGSLVAGLRPGLDHDRQWISCLHASEAIEAMRLEQIALIKIDVEGAELLVLRGLKEILRRYRSRVLCEVLHRDRRADASTYSARLAELRGLLDEIGYKIFRVDRRRDDWRVAHARCEDFPDRIYGRDSEDLCDYLFLPAEEQNPA